MLVGIGPPLSLEEERRELRSVSTVSLPRLKAPVDINIFENVFRQCMGWQANEAAIRAVRNGKVIGYLSALIILILWFFRSQTRPDAEARWLTKVVTHQFRIVTLTNSILKAVFVSALPDFEDAIQKEK